MAEQGLSRAYELHQSLIIAEQELRGLDESYKNQRKGKIFQTRMVQLHSKIAHIKKEILGLGVTHGIIQCTMFWKESIYIVYFTGISSMELGLLIQLKYPDAKYISHLEIPVGIPSKLP